MNKPNNQSPLDSWVEWLLHLHTQEIDLGLDRISVVADFMQVKRPAPIVITVAGTNGKGSSVAMLSAIFNAAGYKVGTYTSPHIVSFNERIQINNQPVSEQFIVDAFTAIELARQETKLTYFEFSTLAALLIFTESPLDVVILEVGLGGRLDAVNVVDADATLITAIDIDHIDWLGDDRSIIATEKAGVMREKQLSVCSDPDVPASLLEYSNKLKVDLYVLNRDYVYELQPQQWKLINLNTSDHIDGLSLPALQGEFQVQNAAGVIELIYQMNRHQKFNLVITKKQLNQGLQNVSHPGRLQKKQVGQQQWLIDVAHNPQSAQVLSEFLNTSKLGSLTSIFSALNDKDMLPMVKSLAPYISEWYVADLHIPRASSLEELTQVLLSAGVSKSDIYNFSNIEEAVVDLQQKRQREVLVWGSFFTVSQVLQSLPDDV